MKKEIWEKNNIKVKYTKKKFIKKNLTKKPIKNIKKYIGKIYNNI